MRGITNLTNWNLKNFLLSAIFTTLLVFIALQVYMLLYPNAKLGVGMIVILTAITFVVSIGCALYYSFQSSREMNKNIRNLVKFVAGLKRGKFNERISQSDHNLLGLIAEELNELAKTSQEQVAAIQRLADEKTKMHEQISAAAVLEERQRLARELHDSVSQQLFALSMMSSATLKMLESNPTKVKEQMGQIASIANKAQGEMRALLLHLRPIDLSGETLTDGIISLLKELKKKTDLKFEASVDDIEDVSKSVEEHLFRIIQEALSNILRHANASKIKLTLTEQGDHIYLYISDNGKGFDTAEERKVSYGLKTMSERCEEIGGHFTIRSQKGRGTYIEIRIPVKNDKGAGE